MAAVLAMFQKTVLRVGVAAARAEHPRRPSLHLAVVVDQLLVEHARAEPSDANAHTHASPEPAEPPEPERQVHRELVRGQLLRWHQLQR